MSCDGETRDGDCTLPNLDSRLEFSRPEGAAIICPRLRFTKSSPAVGERLGRVQKLTSSPRGPVSRLLTLSHAFPTMTQLVRPPTKYDTPRRPQGASGLSMDGDRCGPRH
jgi:hypothetical protein